MINLFSKLFIKNYQDTSNPKVRRAYGMLCSITGICLNIILFIIKYIAGVISSSIAITADAFNNLSDAGSSLITLVGFKFSVKKPDSDHPFGHGRIEYISGLLVSLLIILMGFELIKSSFDKILHPSKVDTSLISVIILIISIMVKLYMTIYNKSFGKKISSTAMNATAMDSLSDSIATSVVLISMLIMKVTGANIDGFSGMLVALFILYAGFIAAKDTLSPLLGQPPEPEFVDHIEQIVMAHSEICGIHDLVVHDYGPGRCMISLHAEVPGDGDIFELHDVIDCIESELNSTLSCESVIHMDPIVTNDENVVRIKNELSDKIKEINSQITIHDFRMVAGPTHTNLIFDAVIPFDMNITDEEAAKIIKNIVHNNFENCFAVLKIDRPYVSR